MDHSIGLLERIAIDAEAKPTMHGCRRALLSVVATLLGTDSAALTDPPWGPNGVEEEARIAALGTSESYLGDYLEHRQRWGRSSHKLLAAMRVRPTIDTHVYGLREREQLAAYRELLRPQGATSILATFVPHGGRTGAMLILKRHGRGRPFLVRDSEVLSRLLPAIGLADAGFQSAFGATARPEEAFLAGEGLSPREEQVAHLAYKGMRNAEIAALLGTSAETVKKQLANAMEKMDVSNRTELAMVWGSLRKNARP